jgi:hypothetical protein
VVRFVAAIVIAIAMLGVTRSTYELRCFLHCHGEGATEVRSLGIPAAYWSYDMVPSDPPFAGPGHFDLAALAIDVISLCLVLCALAMATSARHRPARLDLRAPLPRAEVIGAPSALCSRGCEPPRAPADS